MSSSITDTVSAIASRGIAGTGRATVVAADSALGLRVEVATRVSELVSLQADYERLNRLAANTLPFKHHAWHMAWCTHRLKSTGPVRDELRLCVVRDPLGLCVAIVPLVLTRRSISGVRFGVLSVLGSDSAITEIRGPLIAPGYGARVAWAVQKHLASMPDWDWVHWTHWSGGNAAFGEALAVGAKLHWQQSPVDYVLDLPGSWEELRKGLRRNLRESLRHCYNSLKREGLEFTLQVVAEPAGVKAAVDRFLDLHARRAALEDTIQHPDHFAAASARAFLHELCARLAESGELRIFQLVIRGEIVATRLAFVVGDSLYLYYSGFDPAWGRYSVMTTTLAEAVKYAIEHGLRTVNLSPGTDQGKTRWAPRTMPIVHAVQLSRRPSSRIKRWCFQRAGSGRMLPAWANRLLAGAKRSKE